MRGVATLNLILISEAELAAGYIELESERAEHVRCVHRANPGDRLRIGVLNGKIGFASVESLERRRVRLRIEEVPSEEAPPVHPVKLAVAMCRPPTLHKVLMHATSMGVKEFYFFHSRRVEKSFWQSHSLENSQIEASMRLGLEQAKDTVMPRVHFHPRFRPFAEDVLQKQNEQAPVWIADPFAQDTQPASGVPCTLVLGPEGGFVDFERELFRSLGFSQFALGPRILRVEVATVAVLARAMP